MPVDDILLVLGQFVILAIGGILDYRMRRVYLFVAHVAVALALYDLWLWSPLYTAYGVALLAVLTVMVGYVDAAATLTSLVIVLHAYPVGPLQYASGVAGYVIIEMLKNGRVPDGIPWWTACTLGVLPSLAVILATPPSIVP